MIEPFYEEPEAIFCKYCEEEIIGEFVNLDPDGNPICDECKASICGIDEEGEYIDEDGWTIKYQHEYIADEKEAAYECWCDMQCDIALGK